MNCRLRVGASVFFFGMFLMVGPATFAHQNPTNCDSNSIVLTPTRDKLVVRNGDTISYKVSLHNQSTDTQKACDLTDATVTLTLPAKDGTPTGTKVVLEQNVDYPAETPTKFLGTTPWVVDVNPGVEDAVVKAEVAGILHDAPRDHDALIVKTLGTTVAQPEIRIEKNGPLEAYVSDTITYKMRVFIPEDVPLTNVTVTDPACDDAPQLRSKEDGDQDDILEFKEVWVYTCTRQVRPEDPSPLPNTATATGTGTGDQQVTAEDSHLVEIVPKPVIKITKAGPTKASVGEKITYVLEVWVPVDRPLHDVTVTDPRCDSSPRLASKKGGDNDDLLELGEIWIYKCSHTVKEGDLPTLKNTAEASGKDERGVDATDKANASTEVARVKRKRVTPAPQPGGTLPFTGVFLAGLASTSLGLIGVGMGFVRATHRRGRHRARRRRPN